MDNMNKMEKIKKVKIAIGPAIVFCVIKFDLESQTCGLCRKTLNYPTDYELNTFGINSNPNVTITTCRHGFHKECIQEHVVNENSLSCPTCGVMYEEKCNIITSNLVTDIKGNIKKHFVK